ncbi:MAG: HIRAN domain protein [Lachnospiraceae bacterium]|nr:HIRAN domain protein [Lachnospiraceae bacterium]
MKKMYVTITGMDYYYGLTPFSVGKKLKCIKEKNNPFDSEAIRVNKKIDEYVYFT